MDPQRNDIRTSPKLEPPTIIWLQAEIPRTRLAKAGAREFSRNLCIYKATALKEIFFSIYPGYVAPLYILRREQPCEQNSDSAHDRIIHLLTNETSVCEHERESNVNRFSEANDTLSNLLEIVGPPAFDFAQAWSLQLFLDCLGTLEA